MPVLIALWLACSASAPTDAPVTATSLELPGAYTGLSIPTDGAEVTKHDEEGLVLNYPGGTVRPLVEAYASALNTDGWSVEDPQDGGRFVRVLAHKGDQSLEVYVVAQPQRAEVHLEFVQP